MKYDKSIIEGNDLTMITATKTGSELMSMSINKIKPRGFRKRQPTKKQKILEMLYAIRNLNSGVFAFTVKHDDHASEHIVVEPVSSVHWHISHIEKTFGDDMFFTQTRKMCIIGVRHFPSDTDPQEVHRRLVNSPKSHDR